MKENDFDEIITIEESLIEIGYIAGSANVLFIKTGQGGSIYGYENKYLKLAQKINADFGYTVFVSSTVTDIKAIYDMEMQLVSGLFAEKPYEIYYVGVSKGGLIGCWYGADNPKVKRILTVNAPLMINFHNRTLPAMIKLTPPKIKMVYGSLDPSYRYVGFAEKYATIQIVEGADHQFRGCTSILENLVVDFLSD